VTAGLRVGRPGVYYESRRDDLALQPVRLDVAGFVGVALRGPVDTPVLVSSWSDYERRFGGFEQPDDGPDRLLPFAVQAFFAQGGERAYVLRVAPAPAFVGPSGPEATAGYAFGPEPARPFGLAAADEGRWGDELSVRFDFEVAQSFRATPGELKELHVPTGAAPPDQSLARVRRSDLPPTGLLRWLSQVDDPAKKGRILLLDTELPAPPSTGPGNGSVEIDIDVDVITGVLLVADTSSPLRREERFAGLGLRPGHPRFVPAVLESDSLLVRAVGPWEAPLLPDRFLSSYAAIRTQPGLDRSYGIDFDSFFDDGDAWADQLDELEHHRGADEMGRVPEIGLLCIPDLTWRAEKSSPPPLEPSRVRPLTACDDCDPPEPEWSLELPVVAPLGLDARAPRDLAEIVRRQVRLVQIAELRRRFVVLLDVPAGLQVRRITDWRARFDTSFAAAYHPWLGVPRPGPVGGGAVAVPPASFAAGIVAARERRFGLPWGPANELARGAVLSTDSVTDSIHDELHLLGINVFRAERDGFRLTAARTLSSDPDYRQLSIRRFMTMLALTLERQTQWLVFEPNTSDLRTRLTHTVTQFLRGLHRRGSFAGTTEADSFFVQCDDSLNPAPSQVQGRLIAEIGVAPAAPLEYLVVRISQDVDGTLTVGSDRG